MYKTVFSWEARDMPRDAESKRCALDAIGDSMRLLAEANVALQRTQIELGGEASELTRRMSQQLRFLTNVAELLLHEVQKERGKKADRRLVLIANQSAAGVIPLSHLSQEESNGEPI